MKAFVSKWYHLYSPLTNPVKPFAFFIPKIKTPPEYTGWGLIGAGATGLPFGPGYFFETEMPSSSL